MNIKLTSVSDQTLIDTIGVPFFDVKDKDVHSERSFELDNEIFSASISHENGVVFSSDNGAYVIFTKLEDKSIIVEFLND